MQAILKVSGMWGEEGYNVLVSPMGEEVNTGVAHVNWIRGMDQIIFMCW